MLTTTISFCRRADVLQPRSVPSLEPCRGALWTHLSICWGAQQDSEEQGHAEHCGLHGSLWCGESWVKLEKVKGRFIPPRTPPCPPQEPPGQSQTWQRHQSWQQARPRHRVTPAFSMAPATFPGISPASCTGQLDMERPRHLGVVKGDRQRRPDSQASYGECLLLQHKETFPHLPEPLTSQHCHLPVPPAWGHPAHPGDLSPTLQSCPQMMGLSDSVPKKALATTPSLAVTWTLSPRPLSPGSVPSSLAQVSAVPEHDVAVQRDTMARALVLRQPLAANCGDCRALTATGGMFVLLVIPPLCVCVSDKLYLPRISDAKNLFSQVGASNMFHKLGTS